MSPQTPAVRIDIKVGGTTTFFRRASESDIKRVSEWASKALDKQTDGLKLLVIEDCDEVTVRMVLDRALHEGKALRFYTDNMSLDRAMQILKVIDSLQIKPPQPNVSYYVTHKLSKGAISPTIMTLVHKTFGSQGEASKPWRVMVQALAWDVVNSNLPKNHVTGLKTEAAKHPQLNKAIGDKVKEIRQQLEDKQK